MRTDKSVVALIQARMNSTRLPGKVLADLAGRPMLWQVAARVGRARLVDKVIVVTSTQSADDVIEHFCKGSELPCFRGDESDVLDRFYRAARQEAADMVVRITADCPLIDPVVIDRVIEARAQGNADYATNTLHETFPDGLDVEVFTFEALERAWREATKPSDREHVTPYLRRSGNFKVLNVDNDEVPSAAGQRWTVDEPSDLEFVRAVYSAFPRGSQFGLREVSELMDRQTQLREAQATAIRNDGYYRSLFNQARAGEAPKRSQARSAELMSRAERVIPGCAQTFSKSYNQHVRGVAPMFLERGKGARVWDVDGNKYIDYIQGLLPNILGYAHGEVNAAAAAQLDKGHSFSLPHPLEIELAERLVRLIPCAEMVRFGKNGSDATSGAVRVARAFTGRERVACCGYHGWQDWYIGTTTRNGGVPGAVRDLTHPFSYNEPEDLERLLESRPGEFAGVIMEPVNFVEPKPGYLEAVREIAHRHGALLIFDEICSGFHFGLGGAQKLYGVTPDLACFGKAMGNGFPIACIVGRSEVMKVFEDVFVSFTFAGEVASMAAALKVLDILENTDALATMNANGSRLQRGFNALAKHAGLFPRFECVGRPAWSLIKFRDDTGKDSLLERSLFAQESVKRGVLLLVTHNMTAAHDEAVIDQTLEAYAGVFKTLASWLSDPDPAAHLEGPMIQPVFRVR